MSETPETNEDAKVTDLSQYPDESVKNMWARAMGFAEPMMALHEKIREASPPNVLELDKELNSSDEPAVAEFRAEIKRLEEALKVIREDAHKHILKGYNSIPEAELKGLQAEFTKATTKVRTALTTIRGYADIMELDDVKALVDAYRIPTLRGTVQTPGASAASVPRPRVANVEVKKADGKTKVFATLGAASIFASVDNSTTFRTWLETAGETEWQHVKEVVSFEVNGVKFTVTPENAITPADETGTEDGNDA